MKSIVYIFAAAVILTNLSKTYGGVAYDVVVLHPGGIGNSRAVSISDTQQVGTYGTHAVLWSGTAASVVDLHPSAYRSSGVSDVSGGQQVGTAYAHTWPDGHAMLWSGSAASAVDLHTADLYYSQANGTSGTQQVGYGTVEGPVDGTLWLDRSHALLWSGTPDSVIDLHPEGFDYSTAYGISGDQQVGYGRLKSSSSIVDHALLWYGAANSVVDLHPDGYSWSTAWDVADGQQVGDGELAAGGMHRALLWTGTADSVVDLHPQDGRFSWSTAAGVNNGFQVGYGLLEDTFDSHALLWSGTADSVLDLHQYLPPGEYYSSYASGISWDGRIVGVAWTSGAVSNEHHAVMWVPRDETIPAPGAILLATLGAGMVGWLRRGKRL